MERSEVEGLEFGEVEPTEVELSAVSMVKGMNRSHGGLRWSGIECSEAEWIGEERSRVGRTWCGDTTRRADWNGRQQIWVEWRTEDMGEMELGG